MKYISTYKYVKYKYILTCDNTKLGFPIENKITED